MPLSDIVNVTIERQTRAVSQQGFGTLAIAGTSLGGANPFQVYSSLSAVGNELPASSAEYGALQVAFSQSPTPTRVAVLRIDPADIGASLTAIEDQFSGWYGLALISRDPAHQLAAAAWVESSGRKLLALATSDTRVIGEPAGALVAGPDIASTLQSAGRERSLVLFHESAGTSTDAYAEVAWIARQLATTPGAQTWMFKSLSGVSASALSDSQGIAARGLNANTYESIGGVSITREGRVASGEFIDVIHGMDWLKARLTERIYSRLVNLPKVPYTDAGVAIFEAEIKAQLEAAIQSGVLASDPKPTISVPRVRDVSAQDRANRLLPDIRFVATLAGAIHSVTINGVVSV